MQTGTLLTAFGQLAYLAQAVLALDSIQSHSDASVTLVTDQPKHPLLLGAGFDHIISVTPNSMSDIPHEFALPLLARVHSLKHSPYDCTLSFDVHARIRQSRLDHLFAIEAKDDIAVAPCLSDTSHERSIYARPGWNSGVILYNKKNRVKRMLDQFETLFHSHIKVAITPNANLECLNHIDDAVNRKRLLCSDQIALAQFFPSNKCAQLPEHWNWRDGNPNRVCVEEVVIDHHPNLRNKTFNQLADSAFDFLKRGENSRSSLYYGVVIEALDPQLLKLISFQQLSKVPDLQVLTTKLKQSELNVQSSSLIAVCLLHQRTLQQPEAALSILKNLVAS